jgi:predicted metal-dependent phosphoesterase TrpH
MTAEAGFPAPADLHTHSRVSDGTETPSQLVRAAREAGLGTVALTDHDSTAGWHEASEAAVDNGVTLIPGMELSTRHGWRSVHLLAYLFDPTNGDLVEETARIRQSRLTRAETIVQKLSADYDLTWADVVEQTTPGTTIGRPHIADALVARGFVPTRSEAFAGILHPATGYYLPHYAPDTLDGVRLVRAAGGIPVIAHPATRGRDNVLDEEYIAALAEAGLFGLEIDHRENTPDGRVRLHELAETYDLRITGSSDYHGSGKPNRLGENTTAPEVVQAIADEATGWEPVRP